MASGRFDVVVAGAGPAGSVAALVLARGGARVALVDKAEFPRDKACGDLIGPRGVGLLDELGVSVPDAGQGADLLVVGPSGHRSRLPAFPGRAYPGHGVVVPRVVLDDALRAAAVAAGAEPVRARVSAADTGPDGRLRALLASDGQRLEADAFIGADGALSPVARLAGMLDPDTALWGFAIRAYLPAEVPLPLLVLLDAAPWRIYPGYGWLFPGENGQANVGIGVGLGTRRRQAPLRGDLARFCAQLRSAGDLAPDAQPGSVTGGWLRMGGTGAPPAAGNVLLAGDAAGLINPLQGEGIAPAMVSARLAAQCLLASPGQAAAAYTEAVAAAFGGYLPGAAALQATLLRRPRLASAGVRLLTAPAVRRVIAGTWSLYWNGLVDGASPRPAAWTGSAVQRVASGLARRWPAVPPRSAPPAPPAPAPLPDALNTP
ncbi:MAG TPA: geranylgeranyl reductase family protein [Streptosporangiaceae bacterium]|nr:geranylgeranyl reductase family protein [Streptosporangiaceae bacterium]